MWFQLAWPRPLANRFYGFEDQPAHKGRGTRRTDCFEALRASEDHQNSAEAIPEPPISGPCSSNHPEPNPARRTPTIQSPHYAMISTFDEAPHVAGHVPGKMSRDGHC